MSSVTIFTRVCPFKIGCVSESLDKSYNYPMEIYTQAIGTLMQIEWMERASCFQSWRNHCMRGSLLMAIVAYEVESFSKMEMFTMVGG